MSKLRRITIERKGDGWTITRERETNGESALCETLEQAFDYVRAIYDEQGEFEKHTEESYISALEWHPLKEALLRGEWDDLPENQLAKEWLKEREQGDE